MNSRTYLLTYFTRFVSKNNKDGTFQCRLFNVSLFLFTSLLDLEKYIYSIFPSEEILTRKSNIIVKYNFQCYCLVGH